MIKVRSLGVNALINIIKNMATLLMPLITYPYAARILGVSNMGKYSFSNSVVSYFILLAGLGISSYASREGAKYRDNERIYIFSRQIFSINIFSALIAYSSLFLCILVFPFRGDYKILLLIQSLAILGNLFSINWFFVIFEDYLYVAKRTIISNVITIILIFIFVNEPNDYIIYAGLLVFPNVAVGVFSWIFAGKKYFWIVPTIHFEWRKHIGSIMTLFSATLATTIYVSSDITMLGMFCDDYEVGIYSAAVKVYTAIKTLITAVIMILLPRLTNLLANGMKKEYSLLIGKVQIALLSIVLPISVGLFLTSEYIVFIFAGEIYAPATILLKVLSSGIIFSMASTYLTNAVLLPNDLEKVISFSSWFGAITNIFTNIFFIGRLGALGAAITTVLAEFVVMILQGINSKKYIFNRLDFKDIASIVVGNFFIIIVFLIVNRLIINYIIKFLIIFFLSVIGYLFILYIMKNSFVLWLILLIVKKKKSIV